MTASKNTSCRTWIAATLLACAGSASAIDFANNGRFDSSLDQWQAADGPGPATLSEWNALDVDGDPASGSASITSHLLTSGFRVALSQCTVVQQIPGAERLQLSFSSYIPGGQQRGALIGRFTRFDNLDCSGDAIDAIEASASNTWITDAWVGHSIPFFNFPYNGQTGGLGSLLIQLGAGDGADGQPDPEDTFQGYFDAVRVENERVFEDDFEEHG